MDKRLLLNVLVLFLAFVASAQTRIVRGKVTSSDDGMPMPGVNVVVQGTSKGSATDASGSYSIEIEASENTLVFTFIGYKTQTINIDGRQEINVRMDPDALSLEEVVVIGYGTVRKSDLTGSVSSVRGADLNTVPAINPMQSLQGKVAGLQVANVSGAPGASTYVRIRGIGTFNDASPIYVVDGVILQNIDFLNAADIASMEVLKDASSTAIYGARGANGVIIVTTKRGDTSGSRYPTVNVSAEFSIQELPQKIDLLNGREYAIVRNKINPGTYNNVDVVPNTDWQDLIFQPAPIQNYQASVTGGTDKFQYYTSIGYFRQEGIIPKSDFERVTLRFNNTFRVTDQIRFGSNISFTPFNQQNTNGNAVFVVYRAWPTIEPFLPDGSYSPVPGVGNVLADIDYTNSFSKGIRSVNSLFAEVDFLKGFTFRSSFGADLEYSKSTSYTPIFFVNPQQQNATDDLGKGYFDRTDWLWENTLTYAKEKGVHRINVLAGYTLQESSSETVFLGAENLIRSDPNFWYVNIFPNLVSPNFARNDVSAGFNYSMISYLFRANYTLNNKYLFTATFRRDGSSKFTEANRYANFPSLAVGWNAINENFLAQSGKLSNLKVRASWGIIGNEKINYLRQYSLVLNGINALFGDDIQYPGATYGVSGNPNLKWESTEQINAGLEFGFLDDRLTGEIDYFHRITSDILIDLPVPGYYGNGDGALITFNAGEVLNRGVELVLGWNGEIKNFKYNISANATTIHNETLKVSGTGGTDEQLIGLFNGRQVTRTVPGLPIGSFYGYQVIGVFQNQAELDSYPHLSATGIGDLKFADTNGDGFLTPADRVNLGSPIPKLLYGFSLSGEYKRFDLAIDFQGQQGNKIFNGKEIVRPDPYNFERRYFYFWDGEGTSNTEPRPSNGGINFEPSSRYIYDGSFFRLRNLSLGYTLPDALMSKVGMRSVRAYTRITNLFTVSKFTGYTPEIVSGNPVLNGIDLATYPIPRIYSLGLNITF
ncbi:MAG: TonB-dependent receptor [Cyclobacteriaceae bacterium]|jgi:TonB-linked SusC/RagA family outer membrane protein|nr:TonB-dependent receptor [Cyclobacteriaceae bacterium]